MNEWKGLSRSERAARVLSLVEAATQKYPSVPVNVVMGVVQQESDFVPSAAATDPRDMARGGSHGLVQMSLMTARALGYKGPAGDSAQLTGLYDPETNLTLGTRYLADLYATTHDWPAAISAYNAGLSVERKGDAKRTSNDRLAPFVNQSYVDRVLSFADNFGGIQSALSIVLVVLVAVALAGRLKG